MGAKVRLLSQNAPRCGYHHGDSQRALFETVIERRVDKDDLLKEWQNTLSHNKGKQEICRFIEKFPALIPELFSFPTHNGTLHNIIVSQFPLSPKFVIDFAYASWNSATIFFNFVLVGDSKKKTFNDNLSHSSDFDYSLNLIQEWKKYVNENIDLLKDKFSGLLDEDDLRMQFRTRFYLFYGRRSEFRSQQDMNEKRSKLISSLEENDINIMTYDRLSDLLINSPSLYRSSRQAVCSYVNGSFFWKSEIYLD